MTVCFSVKENTEINCSLKLFVFQVQKDLESFHSKNNYFFCEDQDKSILILLVNKYISQYPI